MPISLPPPWAAWFDALRRAAPHCFMQMATVGYDGARCRTLSLRDRRGTALWFTTDLRTEKVRELEQQPRAEACWYDFSSRVQWRFRGPVHFLTEQSDLHGAERIWNQLDDETRARFYGPPPGSLWRQEPDPAASEAVPEDFALLVLEVENVDVLELAGTPHRHWRYHGEGAAAPKRLVP